MLISETLCRSLMQGGFCLATTRDRLTYKRLKSVLPLQLPGHWEAKGRKKSGKTWVIDQQILV